MKKFLVLIATVTLFSCTDTDLKKENEELLALTKELTQTVEELQKAAEEQAMMARTATLEAQKQADIALHNAAEAMKMKALLEDKLKDCQ